MRDGPEAPRASRDIVSFVLCDSLADVKQPMQFLPSNDMHMCISSYIKPWCLKSVVVIHRFAYLHFVPGCPANLLPNSIRDKLMMP